MEEIISSSLEPERAVFSESDLTASGPQGTCACKTNGLSQAGNALESIFAIGKIEYRFPTLSAERELLQIQARTPGLQGLSLRAAERKVLKEPQNRYLVEELCWILTIEGMEVYLLKPFHCGSLDLIIRTLEVDDEGRPMDTDVVVGKKGPLAPPDMCGGLVVPILYYKKISTFPREELMQALPKPKPVKGKERNNEERLFVDNAQNLFSTILQMADNTGLTDAHRALNYLAVHYDRIYTLTQNRLDNNFILSAIDTRISRLTGTRKVIDVILTYANRQTEIEEKYFTRVDVTEEFPFLVTKLSPYYDR